MKNVETQVICDKEKHHYLLVRVGWDNKKYIHHCVLHFDIKGEKVWLQKNNSDQLIADELMAYGVDRQDIVIGIDPEFVRPHSGFAAA